MHILMCGTGANHHGRSEDAVMLLIGLRQDLPLWDDIDPIPWTILLRCLRRSNAASLFTLKKRATRCR